MAVLSGQWEQNRVLWIVSGHQTSANPFNTPSLLWTSPGSCHNHQTHHSWQHRCHRPNDIYKHFFSHLVSSDDNHHSWWHLSAWPIHRLCSFQWSPSLQIKPRPWRSTISNFHLLKIATLLQWCQSFDILKAQPNWKIMNPVRVFPNPTCIIPWVR